MYRVALTYHPDVGTFRGKRGAWRVRDVFPVLVYEPTVETAPGTLYVPSATVPRLGTWVNPLKILKDYQSTKRSST